MLIRVVGNILALGLLLAHGSHYIIMLSMFSLYINVTCIVFYMYQRLYFEKKVLRIKESYIQDLQKPKSYVHKSYEGTQSRLRGISNTKC